MTLPDERRRSWVVERKVSRRTLLAAGLGAPVLMGCSRQSPLAEMLARQRFVVAHRGGGRDWPEMTEYAYQQAARLSGLSAMEISVCLSSDGVFVCSHDPTTKRMTGADHEIATTPWSTLRQLEVTARETRDPQQAPRPISRLEPILEQFGDDFLLFVEPKTPVTREPLLQFLQSRATKARIVWKQYVNSPLFKAAKDAGFGTWGYVLNEAAHVGTNLQRFASSPDLDLLGAPASESDAFVRPIVEAAQAAGKQTMMWPISDLDAAARAERLGCRGLMASAVSEVMASLR